MHSWGEHQELISAADFTCSWQELLAPPGTSLPWEADIFLMRIPLGSGVRGGGGGCSTMQEILALCRPAPAYPAATCALQLPYWHLLTPCSLMLRITQAFLFHATKEHARIPAAQPSPGRVAVSATFSDQALHTRNDLSDNPAPLQSWFGLPLCGQLPRGFLG